MQAGYRTDPKKSAKALRSKNKIRKLDNAVYGSDVKSDAIYMLKTEGTQTTQTSTVSTQDGPGIVNAPNISVVSTRNLPLVVNTPSSSISLPYNYYSLASPSSVGTPIGSPPSSIGSPITLPKYNISPTHSAVGYEELLKQGVKPSLSPASAPPSIAGVSVIEAEPQRLSLPVVGSNTEVVSPIINTAVSDVVKPSLSPALAPPNTESKQLSPSSSAAPTYNSSNVNGTELQQSVLNSNLQTKAKEFLDELVEKHIQHNNFVKEHGGKQASTTVSSKTIQIYKTNREPDENSKLEVKRRSGNKYIGFALKTNGIKKSKEILDQSMYDLEYSIQQAIDKIPQAQWNNNRARLEGFGLNTPPHFSYRREMKDNNYVLFPAFLNGNIRLYNKGNRTPIVSQSNASAAFLRIVRDIIEHNTFEASDYKLIGPKEAHSVNLFIKRTKPILPKSIGIDTSNAGNINELRKRYQVLVGELAAGNRGDMIKDEMANILHNLRALRAINAGKVNNLISGLDDL